MVVEEEEEKEEDEKFTLMRLMCRIRSSLATSRSTRVKGGPLTMFAISSTDEPDTPLTPRQLLSAEQGR
eukprot:269440-Hanusia_phi.AAC.2